MTTKVRLRHRDAPACVVTTNDLGPRGVFIRSIAPIPLDEPVEMEILLPGEATPVLVEGRVAWSEGAGVDSNRSGMGIRFTRVRNTDSDRLKRFFSIHHAVAGGKVVIVTDEPYEAADLARALAREGLTPQVVRWSDERPKGDAVAAYVAFPNQAGQAGQFASLRFSVDAIRPGLLAVLRDEGLAAEWVRVATMCLHGAPEADRAAALTLCVAAPVRRS